MYSVYVRAVYVCAVPSVVVHSCIKVYSPAMEEIILLSHGEEGVGIRTVTLMKLLNTL